MNRAGLPEERQPLLVFRRSERPSRVRVSVWRRLRREGARLVHRSLFVLPDTPLNRLRATDLTHDVENWEGMAQVYGGDTRAFAPSRVRPLIHRFEERTDGSL